MENPQAGKNIKIEFSVGRHGAVILAAGLLILLLPIIPTTESLTMTTYYPAPYGAYRELRATQSAYLAYSGGSVGVGTSSPGTAKLSVMGGNVGIGTTSPAYLADVNGDLRIVGSLVLNGYITLATPACNSTNITGNLTTCPANQYATTTPGLFQPGETKLTQTKWMYQDGETGTPASWPEPGGSFWCCPK